VLKALWEGLRETERIDVDYALGIAGAAGPSDEPPAKIAETYDRLCAAAASGLRNGGPSFAAVVDLLNTMGTDGPEAFAKYLDLAAVVRAAMTRLPEWVGRMTEERAAAVRI
jgi:hypothetical protein